MKMRHAQLVRNPRSAEAGRFCNVQWVLAGEV